MSLLGSLLKTTIHIASLPVDVVKDVVTAGGTLMDQRECYTTKKLKKVIRDTEEVEDDIDRL